VAADLDADKRMDLIGQGRTGDAVALQDRRFEKGDETGANFVEL